MPEGHVIHRLASQLNTAFAGQVVSVTSPQGVFASQAGRLDGTTLERATAWGKHLFIHFSDARVEQHSNGDLAATVLTEPAATIHIHLGLIGILGFQPAIEPLTGTVRLAISNDTTLAHLHGPQWCRTITHAEHQAAIAKLGADPLIALDDPQNAAKYQQVTKKVRASRRTIGSLLMDQKLYAGVGNIYRAETLFRLGIHPNTTGQELSTPQLEAIWEDLALLMREGVRAGRIDTVAPEHTPEAMGRPPRKDDHGGEVYVYRREGQPCLRCATPIAAAVLEGRNLFWCPGCQATR